MKTLYFPILLLILSGCQSKSVKVSNPPADTIPERAYSDSLLQGAFEIRYLIFGKFCGMCPKNCATMYTYNMMGNVNTLFVDESDGFFKGKIVSGAPLNKIEFHQLAGGVFQKLPRLLIQSKETETTFGCPDCADQCGLYVEIGGPDTRKKFRIDTNIEALEGDLKDFAGLLMNTIEKMDSLRTKKP